MAEAKTETAAPEKKKRKAFTRTAKPLFGVLRIQDGQGGYINFTKEQVELTIERDSGKLLEKFAEGNVSGVLVKIALPAADKPAAA